MSIESQPDTSLEVPPSLEVLREHLTRGALNLASKPNEPEPNKSGKTTITITDLEGNKITYENVPVKRAVVLAKIALNYLMRDAQNRPPKVSKANFPSGYHLVSTTFGVKLAKENKKAEPPLI